MFRGFPTPITLFSEPSKALSCPASMRKAARNIGEDLMEDMLQLDSLANLYQEDRKARPDAKTAA